MLSNYLFREEGSTHLNTEIISFCNNTETVNGILNIFKNEFLTEFKEYKLKERPPILKAIPYLYRIWYYSTLMSDTALSPSNFINAQIEEKYGKPYRVVPIVTPVYKNKILKDFQFDYKVFTTDDHPVLQDLKLFLEHCTPDIEVDENGLLLEEDRDKLIETLTFKEIFYATFLTNLAYSLNFIRKMPSINTYRSMACKGTIESFFSLSKSEQLKKIVDAVIGTVSKSLSALFEFDKKNFSKEALMKLLHSSQNLDEYSRNIFKRLNMDIGDLDLEDLYYSSIEQGGELEIPEDTLMALTLNVEFNFIMDAQFITPLGHYLQLIQPIYNDETVFQFHFAQLVEAFNSNVPPIKLYFFMSNSFDITPLGSEVLLGGVLPEDKLQEPVDNYDFEDIYQELADYYCSDGFLDMDFGDFKMSDDDLDKLVNEFKGMLKPFKQNSRGSASSKSGSKAAVTDSKLAYTFKVKNFYQKRSWQAIELKGTQTLDDLANSIISAFSLDYGHLYSFFMNNKAWDVEYEITSPNNNGHKKVATKHKIHKIKLCEKQKFLFLYDFGDEIKFEVEFTGAVPTEGAFKYPRVVKASKDYAK
jgi:hypothetical protein